MPLGMTTGKDMPSWSGPIDILIAVVWLSFG